MAETKAFSLPCAVNVGAATVGVAAKREVVDSLKSVNPARAALLPFKTKGVFSNRPNVRFLSWQGFDLTTKGTTCFVFVAHR